MPVTHDFEYCRPQSRKETLELLAEYGGRAAILAGGTDLALFLKDDLIRPDILIDIKQIPGLNDVEIKENDEIFMGAGLTFSDIIRHRDLQKNALLLWESAHRMSSVGIRNRATLAGNICSAVPCMDSAPALLCYNAVIHTESVKGSRKTPISDWFLGVRQTARKPDELVTGVSIFVPKEIHSGCYLKLSRYRGEDLAQAGMALLITQKKEYRLAYSAVGPIPRRVPSIEELLSGQEITPSLLQQAIDMVPGEISPITDIRASREYREHMCKIMLERGFQVVNARLQGKHIETLGILGG